MQYDTNRINELAKEVDLAMFISQKYKLAKKSNRNYYIHCPKHVDKTPSLYIDTKKNTYYCFSCHRHGNIITWLMDFEGYTYNQAADYLLKITGKDNDLSFTTSSSMIEFKKYSSPKEEAKIERQVLDFKKEYLEKYCDELPIEWISEGISVERIKKYNIRIDKNNNRIVYPVYDNDDLFIGVKGRTRLVNYKELKIPKYINYYSIGTSNFFQGMHENKSNILKEQKVIIVEGIKSVMKLDDYGYSYGLASETDNLNEGQIKIILSMHLKEIIIAYDKGVDIKDIINNENIKKLNPFIKISIINDKKDLLKDKDAPVDRGKEIWETLYNNRLYIC